MPSFILRNLDPEFWSRVQAKAAREGTTVKALILRLLSQWLSAIVVAALTSACAAPLEPTPVKPTPPQSSAPASLQILAASRTDQRVDVTAVVRTSDGKAVPDVSVTFSATSGTLSPDVATTDGTGTARAILTPQAAQTTVRAEAGGLSSSANVLATIPTTPTPTPPPTPQPSPDPVPPLSVSINVSQAPAGQASIFSLGTQALSRADWTFGDGAATSTTTANTSHVYASPGSYQVGVSVTDVRGRTASTSQTVTIVAPPPPPAQGMIVVLRPDRSSVPVGSTVFYTATIDNLLPGETATGYQWDLDGNGSFEFTSSAPTHNSGVYGTAGFVKPFVAITTNMRTGSGTTMIVVTN